MIQPYRFIPPFAMFTRFTPALPQFYTQVPTMEQGFKELCKNFHKMVCYANELAEKQNVTSEELEKLLEDFEKFKESGFYDYYAEQLEQWIKDNLPWLFQTLASQVYFGLTDDGYFCAYVPESWNDITFDTGAVFGRSDYGRLILRFDASGNGIIDNTYSYSTNAIDDFEQLIADVEIIGRRGDASYDTLFTNMDVDLSNGDWGV